MPLITIRLRQESNVRQTCNIFRQARSHVNSSSRVIYTEKMHPPTLLPELWYIYQIGFFELLKTLGRFECVGVTWTKIRNVWEHFLIVHYLTAPIFQDYLKKNIEVQVPSGGHLKKSFNVYTKTFSAFATITKERNTINKHQGVKKRGRLRTPAALRRHGHRETMNGQEAPRRARTELRNYSRNYGFRSLYVHAGRRACCGRGLETATGWRQAGPHVWE